MANYSDNQVVFFSENKKAVYDLWQKINDYINNSKTNSICGFLESLGYSEYESRNMSDLRNSFVGCDDEVTNDESVSFFYIRTETAWTGNIEVFYRVIEDHYNNEIELYALIEEAGFNIFINTDEEGVYFYPKYKIDAFINDEQIEEYFESFNQVLDFIKKKFPKVKLSSKDTIARLKKKITKVYTVNDDEDFYLNIHRFSSMYPF